MKPGYGSLLPTRTT